VQFRGDSAAKMMTIDSIKVPKNSTGEYRRDRLTCIFVCYCHHREPGRAGPVRCDAQWWRSALSISNPARCGERAKTKEEKTAKLANVTRNSPAAASRRRLHLL